MLNRPARKKQSYAVLALQTLQRINRLPSRAERNPAIRLNDWLVQNYQANDMGQQVCWLAKEMYRPYRVARMIELAATLQCFGFDRASSPATYRGSHGAGRLPDTSR